MMHKYRFLEKGEIIQVGDEVDASSGIHDDARWVPVENTIGTPAPDPCFPAHRVYRRRVADRSTVITHTDSRYHAELHRDGDELPYEISIKRTKHDDTFYIEVRSPSGLMAYDGYWTGGFGATIDDAIAEALVGSGLESERPSVTQTD